MRTTSPISRMRSEHSDIEIVWHCGPIHRPEIFHVNSTEGLLESDLKERGTSAGARLFGTPVFMSDARVIEVGFVSGVLNSGFHPGTLP